MRTLVVAGDFSVPPRVVLVHCIKLGNTLRSKLGMEFSMNSFRRNNALVFPEAIQVIGCKGIDQDFLVDHVEDGSILRNTSLTF